MKIKELFESNDKHVSFVFGRMNPPTLGHKHLIDVAAKIGGDYKVFLSQTQDKKNNPLDYTTKIQFAKAMFPEHADRIVNEPNLNTVLKVAEYLHNQGYNHVTLVAGSDRIDSLGKLLKDYNGVEGKAHGYYKFDTIEIKSSGEREDGAEGVKGISASNARMAAANNNLDLFKTSTGAGEYSEKLFNAVRKGMNITENFADGRNPQDKGDSKRHGINTKASISSLRKTAKQGGRKGQLAHWLANMKSGRAKK